MADKKNNQLDNDMQQEHDDVSKLIEELDGIAADDKDDQPVTRRPKKRTTPLKSKRKTVGSDVRDTVRESVGLKPKAKKANFTDAGAASTKATSDQPKEVTTAKSETKKTTKAAAKKAVKSDQLKDDTLKAKPADKDTLLKAAAESEAKPTDNQKVSTAEPYDPKLKLHNFKADDQEKLEAPKAEPEKAADDADKSHKASAKDALTSMFMPGQSNDDDADNQNDDSESLLAHVDNDQSDGSSLSDQQEKIADAVDDKSDEDSDADKLDDVDDSDDSLDAVKSEIAPMKPKKQAKAWPKSAKWTTGALLVVCVLLGASQVFTCMQQSMVSNQVSVVNTPRKVKGISADTRPQFDFPDHDNLNRSMHVPNVIGRSVVVADQSTGVEYIMSNRGGLSPRYDSRGHLMKIKPTMSASTKAPHLVVVGADSQKQMKKNGDLLTNVFISVDKHSGVEYIVTNNGGMTPRLNRNGKIVKADLH